MKKFGKFEKRPEAAQKKQPNVKSALLQTYMTSLLCLLLCVTMFFGTSYAWFTSEVTNEGNEIYIGTLDVGLFKQTDAGWASLSEKADGVNKTNLFDKGIRWEPGFTALETIKVVNEGDLAFKYELSFTDGKLANSGTSTVAAGSEELSLLDVAAYFDVFVYNHRTNTKAISEFGSFDAIAAEGSGWTPVGTLKEVLEGKVVLEGNMVTVRKGDPNADPTAPTVTGFEDAVATEDTYTIALHMKESANDPKLMGKKISLNVKLIAYQMAKEQDSFGNTGYDDADYVTNLKQLQDALDKAEGETTIRLGCDITGDVTVTQKPGVKITVDGNGHNFNGIITVDGKSARYETAALTIQNVKFSGVTCADSSTKLDAYIRLGHVDAARYTNNVTVKNCTFSSTGETMVAVKSYTGGDKNLTVTGCTVDAGMHSLLQVANVEEGLKIFNCTVKSKNGINLNSTPSLEMVGCTFEVKGYAIRFGQGGAFASDEINKVVETYILTTNVLKSACAETGDAVIIFRGDAVNATLTLDNTTLDGTTKVSGNTGETTIKGLN